jgi:hypothetical protein
MSLLVKALRQLDARQPAADSPAVAVFEPPIQPTPEPVVEVPADAPAVVAAPVAETAEPPVFETAEPLFEEPIATEALEESISKTLEILTSQEIVDEELAEIAPEPERDPIPEEPRNELTPEPSDIPEPLDVQVASFLPASLLSPAIEIATPEPEFAPIKPSVAISSFETQPSYPTLAEVTTSIAAEEFPSITTPTDELLTEIDLTEATVVPAPTQRVEKQIETALDRLDELRALISASELTPATNAQNQSTLKPISAAPVHEFRIREEFREMRDHLLARYALPRGAVLLFVDAGRATADAAWLFPLAASLLQHFAESMPQTEAANRPPRALLVEAAGTGCGLANSLGLEAVAGLSDVLQSGASWKSAVLSTWHPQIALLGRGTEPLTTAHDRLPALFKDLSDSFDVVLIAGGATPEMASNSSEMATDKLRQSAATVLAYCASAAFLCVELDGTPQTVAVQAKRNLAASGLNLIGCVVQGDAAA